MRKPWPYLGAMTTTVSKYSYLQPLAVNGLFFFALWIGYLVLRSHDIYYGHGADMHEPPLGEFFVFIASVGLIPLGNFLGVIYSLIVKQNRQAMIYGISCLITFLATTALWLYVIGSYQKISG
jgi:hypothetical protein